MIRTVTVILVSLATLGGVAAAQGTAQREEIRKKMEEISSLMRDSERLLREITTIDRLIQSQAEIVRKLRELEQPNENQAAAAPNDAEAQKERARQREELEREQAEVKRKLEEMFDKQRRSAELSVVELQKLLESLPRQQGGGGHSPDQKDEQSAKDREKERQKRLNERERTQMDPNQPRDDRDRMKEPDRGPRKPESETEAARMRRVEAWVARLPPEIQERLNRGDFSAIPVRYRRLVREYTALRAKRESTPEDR